jgi:hypothetical protein
MSWKKFKRVCRLKKLCRKLLPENFLKGVKDAFFGDDKKEEDKEKDKPKIVDEAAVENIKNKCQYCSRNKYSSHCFCSNQRESENYFV